MLSSDDFQKPLTAKSKHAPSPALTETLEIYDAYNYKAVIGAIAIGL